ncbi:MAG: RHS repeat-associated core domain-containing protein [Muribaculaceae bacterium]
MKFSDYHNSRYAYSIELYHRVVTRIEEDNSYYPYGMSVADNYFWNQPYKFGGKELDRMNGLDLYDFGARMLDSAAPTWGTQDPMAEKYYSISPYSYCGGNPIRYVDPNGMDWVSSSYQGTTFYFYDSTITSEEQMRKKYGKEANISYVGASGVASENKDNTFALNSDGSFSLNGTTMSSEYDSGNFHVGSDNLSTFADENKRNYFGFTYLGGDNPKETKNGKDSYSMVPINQQDYNAYLHDKDYNNVGVSGIGGVLSPKTIKADAKLAIRSVNYMINNGVSKSSAVAGGTAVVFGAAAIIKSSLKYSPSVAGLIYNLFAK